MQFPFNIFTLHKVNDLKEVKKITKKCFVELVIFKTTELDLYLKHIRMDWRYISCC